MYCVFLPIDGGGASRWQGRLEGALREGEPLSHHTTYRVGGPAKYLVVPANADDVREVFACGEDVFVMGGGSNLLASDAGYDGVVLKVFGTPGHLSVHGDEVVVGAGRTLPSLVRSCAEMGLSGLEWAVGVPGTIGGASRTNAGAFGAATWELIEYVEVVAGDGSVVRLGPGDVEHGYRSTRFPVPEPFAVTEVALRLEPSEASRVEELSREYKGRRNEKQPIGEASAGSVFKNPADGPPAGALIDKAGFKGLKRGDAVVSTKHANFIVNEGGASAADIYDLIGEIREGVKRRFDVTLELEIQLVGDFRRG
jgi:UDP-N-acetylmuramate dehydrogenase